MQRSLAWLRGGGITFLPFHLLEPQSQSGHFLYAAIPGDYENLRKQIILAGFDSEPLTSEDLFLDLELPNWQRKTWYNCTTAFSA